MGGVILKMHRPPAINYDIWERYRKAIYVYTGRKGKVRSKTLEESILNTLESGYLVDADKVAQSYGDDFWTEFDPSTAILNRVGSEEISQDEFLVWFDQQFYCWDKMSSEKLNQELSKKLDTDKPYVLKKTRRMLRESNRMQNIRGTSTWIFDRNYFNTIDNEMKMALEQRIEVKGLKSFITDTDKSLHILNKFNLNEPFNFEDFCKAGNMKTRKTQKKAKSMIKGLIGEGLVVKVKNRVWMKVDSTNNRLAEFNRVLGIDDG